MKSSTRDRLITCLLVAACGLVWSGVVLRRAPRGLTLTLQGFGTNHEGVVFAKIIASNVHDLSLTVFSDELPLPAFEEAFEDENFYAPAAKRYSVRLPNWRPCKVFVRCDKTYPTNLIGRALKYLGPHVYTLEIP